jgi:hypothetical protein
MIAGPVIPGASTYTVPADRLVLNAATLNVPGKLVRAAAWLDGLGGSAGYQVLTPVIYDAGSALVAAGDPVAVDQGDVARWVPLRWAEAGADLPAGTYRYGFQSSAVGNVTRIARDSTGVSRFLATAAYSAGAPVVLPALTTLVGPFSMFLEVLVLSPPPLAAGDAHLARLPFAESQSVFGAAGALAGTARSGRAGWHGPSVDPERGAFAIARTGGPFEDLVGERLKITRKIGSVQRSVYVYCHDEQEWPDNVTDEDLSLTGRAWLAIGGLYEESGVRVRVEVAAPTPGADGG